MKLDGIPVIDAKRKLKITISPSDVKKGNAKKPDACAAAQACLRQVEGATAAKVHLARTYVKIENKRTKAAKWVRFGTPHSVRGEIISFDRGGTFELGEYEFAPVQPSCRFSNIKKRKRYDGSKGNRHGKTSPRSKPHFVHNVRRHAPGR